MLQVKVLYRCLQYDEDTEQLQAENTFNKKRTSRELEKDDTRSVEKFMLPKTHATGTYNTEKPCIGNGLSMIVQIMGTAFR